MHDWRMDIPSQFSISDLLRRIENLLKVVVIHAVDFDAQKLQIASAGIISGWLDMPGEVTHNYLRWRPLKPGVQVLIACESGDLANAIIVQILYNAGNQPLNTSETLDYMQFTDGALISYDTDTSTLTAELPSGGTIRAAAPQGEIDIHADQGTIKLTADDGQISASAQRGVININADHGRLFASSNNGGVEISANAAVVDVVSLEGTINLTTQGGKINATCLQGFDILGDVSITGNLACTGSASVGGNASVANNVSAGGSVSDATRSMADDRLIYNVHAHANAGAAPPNPQQ